MAQGDKEKQDRLYADAAAAHAAAIDRLARGYEADADLRRDLVQDIHVALWRSFAAFEGACSVRTWVYRVAHNVAASHVLSRRRLRDANWCTLDDLPDLATPGDVEGETGDRQLVDALLAAIRRLKPVDRQVMLLYLEDLSASDIGEVTGLSSGAVSVRIHRIKALLAAPYRRKDLA